VRGNEANGRGLSRGGDSVWVYETMKALWTNRFIQQYKA